MLEIADPRVAFRKRQTVEACDPEHRRQTSDGETVHEHGEIILHPHESAVEQSQTGQRHEEHEHGGGEHPGRVAGIESGTRVLSGKESRATQQ